MSFVLNRPYCLIRIVLGVGDGHAVVLYYDHLITLTTEVSKIWPRARSRPAFLFFLNRYVPFIGNIIVSVYSFTNLADTDKVCV